MRFAKKHPAIRCDDMKKMEALPSALPRKQAPKASRTQENKKRNRTQLGRNWGPYPAFKARLVNHRKNGGGGWTRTNETYGIMRPKTSVENTVVAALSSAKCGKVRQNTQPRRNYASEFLSVHARAAGP